jgi:Holliday junction resolvase RusA-like endonuclease
VTRFECTLAVAPVPKGRPRFGSGRVYTPERTQQFETTLRWLLRQATLKQGCVIPVLAGDVALELDFWVARRDSDADNYAKAVMDAGNKILYKDDRQVSDMHARLHKIATGISPHIDLVAWEVDSGEPGAARHGAAGQRKAGQGLG